MPSRTRKLFTSAAVSLLAMTSASCSAAPTGDKAPRSTPFTIEEKGTFEEPWALAFDQGTGTLFVAEKKGAIRFLLPDGKIGTVSGVPMVDYGGQGGLGDFAFAPGQAVKALDRRVVYLSWAESTGPETRGAAVARATMFCTSPIACDLRDLKVIWRQSPPTTGRGHYSHRLTFSPDGAFLYVASGDRQKMEPAQDPASDLGKIVRIPIDVAGEPSGPAEQFSLGHRNILGMRFDSQGRLWEVEHGPAGGDELNLVTKGGNYGWPKVSNGSHYDGRAIPDHSPGDGFVAPALSWNPVIAPGDMLFYSGNLFSAWKGHLLITAMAPAGLVRAEIAGETAREAARYPTKDRIRSIAQAPDGAIWIVEDSKSGTGGRLLRLTPPPPE